MTATSAATTAAMGATAETAATDAARATYTRIFDARRLSTCLDCLKANADQPPPLPDWFLGRHAERAASNDAAIDGLDEVAVLAAGRRPCATCRPDAAMAFAEAWARANGLATPPSFEEIDAMLGREGLTPDRDDGPVWVAFVDTLPDGAVVIDDAVSPQPAAIRGGSMLPWSDGGWGDPVPRSREKLVTLVTPPSTVATLAAGYRPAWSAPGDDGHHHH